MKPTHIPKEPDQARCECPTCGLLAEDCACEYCDDCGEIEDGCFCKEMEEEDDGDE